MPQIKIMHVVSFSSEDKVHKAENLLNLDTYRKWKCATPGEKQVSVVLQFEKASIIHSIDIGNEGSAFVEVLVSRSSDTTKDFQVLLVASSFMSPLEGRQGVNINRVRMFGPEKLSKTVINEKWDRVKLVCTQPFNKNTQYGLSFVKFHSPEEQSLIRGPEGNIEGKNISQLGAFKLKPDIDINELSVGTLFARRNEVRDSDPVTGPPAIRAASTLASAVLSSAKNNLKASLKDQQASLWKMKESEQMSYAASTEKGNSSSPKNILQGLGKGNYSKKTVNSIQEQKKREYEDSDNKHFVKRIKGKKTEKIFNTLMGKVVFVLSGFQNPFRSDLRDKAMEMGAKYKADWDDTCTHLVCAFSNTPKYNQVFAKGGHIVTKEWIIDCHKKKQLLPWKKYMLGKCSQDTSSETETDEIDEEINIFSPGQSRNSDTGAVKGSTSPAKSKTAQKFDTVEENTPSSPTKSKTVQISEMVEEENSDEYYNALTDVDSNESDVDTEDELLRAEAEAANIHNISKNGEFPEENLKADKKDILLPELPNFFTNKHFLLYGSFTAAERHILQRCIIAYDGKLHDYMDEKVKYVVTRSVWDKNFDEALNDNESIVFVKPEWIYKCDEMHKIMPYQPFAVVPNG